MRGHLHPLLSESKTELLDVKTNSWSFVENYPYAQVPSHYAIIYHNGGFIVFGVYDFKQSHFDYIPIIARFDEVDKKWSQVGTLNVARRGHNVIYDGESFIVVGG